MMEWIIGIFILVFIFITGSGCGYNFRKSVEKARQISDCEVIDFIKNNKVLIGVESIGIFPEDLKRIKEYLRMIPEYLEQDITWIKYVLFGERQYKKIEVK